MRQIVGDTDYTILEPTTFDQACQSIAFEVADLVAKKQHDYGQGNILAFGEYGVLVRLNDKVERLKNLLGKSKPPANEPIEDTWRDIVGYGLIALMLRRGSFTLPLSADEEAK